MFDEGSDIYMRVKHVPRVGEEVHFNVVQDGIVTRVHWREGIGENMYPTIIVTKPESINGGKDE